MHLWVGDTYRDAWFIALIIMFSYNLPLVQSFANSVLEATSKFSFKAITYISLIIIGTAAGTYFVRYFGILALIIGSVSGWILSQIIMNIYYCRVLKLEIARFFKELLSGLLPAFIAVIVLCFATNYIPGSNWLNLFIKIGIYFVVFVFMMFRFGLNQYEKDVFVGAIPFLSKK